MRLLWLAPLAALSFAPAPASAQAVLGGSNLNSTPPVNSIGNESQYYIDWASGRVYGPKTLGVWSSTPVTTLSTSSTGPIGPAGGVLSGTFPNPSFAANAAVSNQFLTGTAAGAFTRAQPSIANISGWGTGVATALGNTAGGVGGFALVGTTPPTGAAGGDLTGTYPNPTLAAILSAGGPTGSATVAPIITYDAKGRLTAVSSATITPAIGSVTGLGTGVATALGVNIGSAGAPVLFNGAGGTPSSITLTSATGLPISTGVSGLGTGVATALAVNVGTAGSPVVNGGALGTPSSGVGSNLTALNASNISSGSLAGARLTNAGLLRGTLAGANLNTTADQAITVPLPSGTTTYRVLNVLVSNPSISLTTAVCGVWTGAGKTGTTIVGSGATGVAMSGLTTNTAGASGSLILPTVNNGGTAMYNSTTVYFACSTAQGSTATADVVIAIIPTN